MTPVSRKTLPPDYLDAMSEALKALAHPQRLRILEFLDLHGERCAGEIIEALGLDQSAASQHLSKMRIAGVLGVRRAGTRRFFFIAGEHPVTILNCMRKKIEETSS